MLLRRSPRLEGDVGLEDDVRDRGSGRRVGVTGVIRTPGATQNLRREPATSR